MTGHNPDILTCLANLSADEVFTPPKLASAMLDLLPPELFRSPQTTFLDPVCKSGVFLREIARRLNDGLADRMPDDQKRIDHILTKQVFGLAITELTSLISRRSVYCSKKADGKFSIAGAFDSAEGNIRLPRTRHTWTREGRCEFCGASRGEYDRDQTLEEYAYPFIHGIDPREEFNMKFDVIVGNPPYQLSDGGGSGTSARPIYNFFVEQAKKLEPRFLMMVIPSRWFTGGKGLDEFRESMLSDNRIRSINDYLMASDVFPGVALKGGVCYFLWDRDNPGLCDVNTHFKSDPPSKATRKLLEIGAEVFVRYNTGLSILKKIVANEGGAAKSVALPDDKRFDKLVSTRRPFGLNSTFKGKSTKSDGDVSVYRKGGTGFTSRSSITNGSPLIDKWKVYIGFAAPGTGNKDTYPSRIISTPFIGEPGSISSETYLCIGPLKSKKQAESVLSYISCRLTRLLILLHKPSQNTTRKVYTFVPMQTWDRVWTDEELYAKYGVNKDEIAFIESMVRPMDHTDDDSDEAVYEIDDE
ncbi:MAG: Eco57I restriction-modification methylase domain-containing protein [Phycisphaerales bacterium]|jgi:site-specific DNA-methyltransferase (adenine-specific)|nr:Eco57I restriction-modification methylase domain-containing protein [Phycisphaerales bacterium]